MNSAWNQMPLAEQSRRITQIIIWNQQNELSTFFYGISKGPAAFSAFMNKIFWPLIISKKFITHLDDVFMLSQTKNEMLFVLDNYHPLLFKENMKAASEISNFFSPV